MRRREFLFTLVLFFLTLRTRTAFADKASTSIEAPKIAPRGSEIMIRVTVTHGANSSLHYTEWLKVMVNQKEIARWDYSGSNRPEAGVFTKEIKTKVLENMEVTAEANCNRHGSKGPTTLKITVKD